MKKLITTLSLLLIQIVALGQSPTKAANVWLDEHYAGLKDLEWERDAHDNYEAQFKHGGLKYRVDFDSSGHWIETERSIKWSDLPDAVKEALKHDEQFDKKEIAELEWVNSSKYGEFYEIEIKDKGKNTDLNYKPDGTRIN